jgi:hypothetical protein
METQTTSPRTLSAIARDIYRDWKPVNYAAAPYLDAMSSLGAMDDSYYYDSARSVVSYFLANAGTWRGPVAKQIKSELKTMLKS